MGLHTSILYNKLELCYYPTCYVDLLVVNGRVDHLSVYVGFHTNILNNQPELCYYPTYYVD